MAEEEFKSKIYDHLFGEYGCYHDIPAVELFSFGSYMTLDIDGILYRIEISMMGLNKKGIGYLIYAFPELYTDECIHDTHCLSDCVFEFIDEKHKPETYEDYLNFRKLLKI